MRRTVVFALIASAIVAFALLGLEQTLELLAWEAILLALLFILFRIFPRPSGDATPPLFWVRREEPPRPPRSVSSYELATVRAFSESPGADRRLKVIMRRIAHHRLRQRGLTSDSPRAAELIDPALFADTRESLGQTELERLVEQLESL